MSRAILRLALRPANLQSHQVETCINALFDLSARAHTVVLDRFLERRDELMGDSGLNGGTLSELVVLEFITSIWPNAAVVRTDANKRSVDLIGQSPPQTWECKNGLSAVTIEEIARNVDGAHFSLCQPKLTETHRMNFVARTYTRDIVERVGRLFPRLSLWQLLYTGPKFDCIVPTNKLAVDFMLEGLLESRGRLDPAGLWDVPAPHVPPPRAETPVPPPRAETPAEVPFIQITTGKPVRKAVTPECLKRSRRSKNGIMKYPFIIDCPRAQERHLIWSASHEAALGSMQRTVHLCKRRCCASA